MKKIVLSTIAALTLGTVAVNAAAFTLYEDSNGQVFTKPGAGRTEMVITTDMVTNKVQKEEVYSTPKTVKLSEEDKAEIKQDLLAEVKKATPLFSKSDKLKFSVLSYLGYRYDDYKTGQTSTSTDYQHARSAFEIRRAYFQVKAYLLDDKKSYYRVTLDATKDDTGDEKIRMKYAYLYLDNILPSTGVELGLVHRPWHDYEEHNAWYYRNISKVLVEAKNGADLSNSADFGFNLKTKTKYFDSEVGLFNGEGYHSAENDDNNDDSSDGMSLEWRTTAHLLGVSGKDKQTTKTYLDASFFGQYNMDHKANTAAPGGYDDLIFLGLHTVYNQPNFLVSAQYIYSDDTADNSSYVSAQAGEGYSVNSEFRFGGEKEYRILGRYDVWTRDYIDTDSKDDKDQIAYIAGMAWEQSKNVQWVANVTVTDNEDGSGREKYNGNAYMLTAEVRF